MAKYDIWLFKRKYIDEFFQKVMLGRHQLTNTVEEIQKSFDIKYIEGEKYDLFGSYYEREPNLRKDVIKRFKSEHAGKLYCAVCGFDFSEKYGVYGEGFIEVHHVIPLSEDERGIHNTTLDELICVCANCHRMFHHKSPAMKPEELRKILRK